MKLELTMTDISCELLRYGSAELGIAISKKVDPTRCYEG